MVTKFQKKPGGSKQRLGSGDWEQSTNRQQRRLTRAFDKWSAQTRRALVNAANRGLTAAEQVAILDRAMPELEAQIIAILEVGTNAAARISAGERAKLPAIRNVIEEHNRDDRLLVAGAMIPLIYARVMPEIARGLARDPRALMGAFGAVRAAPGQYAGRAWVMIFDTQKELGTMRESERRAEGKTVEPVRWDLDPRAEHCSPSPGHHGCPELAGVYEGGWSTLETVPAGLTTCRGNCRCTLWVFRDGQWRRGVFDD